MCYKFGLNQNMSFFGHHKQDQFRNTILKFILKMMRRSDKIFLLNISWKIKYDSLACAWNFFVEQNVIFSAYDFSSMYFVSNHLSSKNVLLTIIDRVCWRIVKEIRWSRLSSLSSLVIWAAPQTYLLVWDIYSNCPNLHRSISSF